MLERKVRASVSVLAPIISSLLAGTASGSPFQAPNCQLTAPPYNAGDDVIFGRIAKIHPRLKDFPQGYTGCQIVWVQEENGWRILNVTYFENGDAASFWMPLPEELLCQYRSGQPVSPADPKCPPHEYLGTKSTPPGCVNRMLNRGDVKGCKYE